MHFKLTNTDRQKICTHMGRPDYSRNRAQKPIGTHQCTFETPKTELIGKDGDSILGGRSVGRLHKVNLNQHGTDTCSWNKKHQLFIREHLKFPKHNRWTEGIKWNKYSTDWSILNMGTVLNYESGADNTKGVSVSWREKTRNGTFGYHFRLLAHQIYNEEFINLDVPHQWSLRLYNTSRYLVGADYKTSTANN